MVKIKDIVEKNIDIKKDIVEKNIVEVLLTWRKASRLQAPPAPRPGRTPRERITGKRREARLGSLRARATHATQTGVHDVDKAQGAIPFVWSPKGKVDSSLRSLG